MGLGKGGNTARPSLKGCTKEPREWEPVKKYEMNRLLLLRVGGKKKVPGQSCPRPQSRPRH